MSKPLGLRMGADATMRVTRPSRVEDAIWNAVEEAVDAHWTPQQVKNEVASAFEEAYKRLNETA